MGPALETGPLRMAPAHSQGLAGLEARIGHVFGEPKLLELALTHVSAVAVKGGRGQSYQRLEFLGDRVLGLVVSDLLYERFPLADEGELSRRLAQMVRKETCADIAIAWDIGPHLRLGGGEAQSGGRGKLAILSDVCESIVGAVFLDGGYAAARGLVDAAWSPRMMASAVPVRDAKTTLQEWAQARGLPPPDYREVSRSGPAHAPQFLVAVSVEGYRAIEAVGASKRAAEQAAAERFAAEIGLDPGEAGRGAA